MRLSEGTFRVFGVLKWVPLLGAFVAAQGLITLDQAGSRSGHDLIAAHEGRQVKPDDVDVWRVLHGTRDVPAWMRETAREASSSR